MKYCKQCGKELDDDAHYCTGCGAVQDEYRDYEIDQNVVNEQKSGLKLAAFVLSLLTTISVGIFIIPLLWCIPMTMKIYRSYKNNEQLSTGFKVCSLIFLNTIAGILLLVDDH